MTRTAPTPTTARRMPSARGAVSEPIRLSTDQLAKLIGVYNLTQSITSSAQALGISFHVAKRSLQQAGLSIPERMLPPKDRENERFCSHCEQWLPFDAFSFSNGYRSRKCKLCDSLIKRSRSSEPPEERDGERRCNTCNEMKPLDQYGYHGQYKDKLKRQCKACNTATARQYREARTEQAMCRDCCKSVPKGTRLCPTCRENHSFAEQTKAEARLNVERRRRRMEADLPAFAEIARRYGARPDLEDEPIVDPSMAERLAGAKEMLAAGVTINKVKFEFNLDHRDLRRLGR